MNDEELLARATRFDAGPPVHINGRIIPPDWEDDELNWRITVEARYNCRTHQQKWAVCHGGSCLSKSAKAFVYESMNSSRTDEYIQDTRFDSVQEAFDFLHEYRVAEYIRVKALGYKELETA